ncbi:unnamed protein product [Eruca vesicaria subsp. sativa]|uniref:Uncharacterized protein n=1 Tax=Eruca vesicaria subsp. sativa TaxID=29727 RepID=A0ABC8LKG3_ERUVS|nr:unnamed protein product [Eruca vesicaria subsp. sativa]
MVFRGDMVMSVAHLSAEIFQRLRWIPASDRIGSGEMLRLFNVIRGVKEAWFDLATCHNSCPSKSSSRVMESSSHSKTIVGYQVQVMCFLCDRRV